LAGGADLTVRDMHPVATDRKYAFAMQVSPTVMTATILLTRQSTPIVSTDGRTETVFAQPPSLRLLPAHSKSHQWRSIMKIVKIGTAILFGVIISIASNSAMARRRSKPLRLLPPAGPRVALPVKWLPMPLWSAPNG
jgi:hypothetical protein